MSKLILATLGTVATIGGCIVLYKDHIGGGRFRGSETLYGRTAIVTGASSGIGFITSQELATRGVNLIMACRDMEKCEGARDVIIGKSHNKKVTCKQLDLASFQSVRNFAEDVNKNEERVDILINNAGVMGVPRVILTEDKIEEQFAVNYLGHFLLTQLLLDKLKASAPSRIINNTSMSYRKAKINFEDLNNQKNYSFQKAYGQSKLASMIFTQELDKRLEGTGVQPFCSVTNLSMTKIHRYMNWYQSILSGLIFTPVAWMLMSGPNVGSQNVIHCALTAEIDDRTREDFSIFQKQCKPIKDLSGYKFDEAESKRLWATSEVWTGLKDYSTEQNQPEKPESGNKS